MAMRLVGHDADRPAADGGERGDQVRRPLRPAARAARRRRRWPRIDVAHVVAAGGGGGDAARRPRGWGGRRDRRCTSAAARRRRSTAGRRGGRRARRARRRRSATTSAATPVLRAWTPAPPSSVGVERLAGEGLAPCAGRSRRRRRPRSSPRGRPGRAAGPGPDTTGPVAARSTGTRPEQRTSARAAVPQPCRAATPSCTSAPLEAMQRRRAAGRRRAACSAAAANVWPSASDERAASVARRRSRPARPRGPPSVVSCADSEPGWSAATGTVRGMCGVRPRGRRARLRRGRRSRRRCGCTPSMLPASRRTTSLDRLAQRAGRAPRAGRAGGGPGPPMRRARPSTATRSQLPSSQRRGGGGRDDGGAEALEGERGDEAQAVDLGLWAAARCRPRPPRRRARRGTTVPFGSSSSSWSARSASVHPAAAGERVAVGRDDDAVLVEQRLGRRARGRRRAG